MADQHVLDEWARADCAEDDSANRCILSVHVPLANIRRQQSRLPLNCGLVAYRWTHLDQVSLYGRNGVLEPRDDDPPGMKVARQPGIAVPPEDYAAVVAATGYTPPDGWKLYIFVPVY